jgi:hypothetical protein
MKKSILLVALFIATISYGQKMKVSEGSIKNLKGITQFDLEFDYSDLQIPKYKSEEAFLADKVAGKEKKAKGSGERWKKKWFENREERFTPMFIESFNKRFKKGRVKVENDIEDAKYVMKIHTTWMYAGYNVGIVRHNAEINTEITVYEKANPSNILLKGTYKKVQGNGAFGNDYDEGFRISHCYAKLAKNIAVYILKKAK